MRSFLVRKINNFTKTLSLRAKVPNTYGTRLYIARAKASVNGNSIRNTFTDCIHAMYIVLVYVLA